MTAPGDPPNFPDDWTLKLRFARAHGLVSATFDEGGNLRGFALGPELPQAPTAQKQPATQAQQHAAERDRVRSVTLASGSRLVEVPRGPGT